MKNSYSFLTKNIYITNNDTVIYSPNVSKSGYIVIKNLKDDSKKFFKILSEPDRDYCYLIHNNKTIKTLTVKCNNFTENNTAGNEVRPIYGGIVSLAINNIIRDDRTNELVVTDKVFSYDTSETGNETLANLNTEVERDVKGCTTVSSHHGCLDFQYDGILYTNASNRFSSDNKYFLPETTGIRFGGNCIISGLEPGNYTIGFINSKDQAEETWDCSETFRISGNETNDKIKIKYINYSPQTFWKYAIGSFYPSVQNIINNLIINDMKSKNNNNVKYALLSYLCVNESTINIYKVNGNYLFGYEDKQENNRYIINIDGNEEIYLTEGDYSDSDMLNKCEVIEYMINLNNNNGLTLFFTEMDEAVQFAEEAQNSTSRVLFNRNKNYTAVLNDNHFSASTYNGLFMTDIYMYLQYGIGNGNFQNIIDSNTTDTLKIDQNLNIVKKFSDLDNNNTVDFGYVKNRLKEITENNALFYYEGNLRYEYIDKYLYSPEKVMRNRIVINRYVVEHLSSDIGILKSDLTHEYLDCVMNEVSRIVSPIFSNPKNIEINVSLLPQETRVPGRASVCIYDNQGNLKQMDTIILEIFLRYAEMVIPNDKNYQGNELIEDFLEFVSGIVDNLKIDGPAITWKFLGNKIYPLTVDPTVGWKTIGVICAVIDMCTDSTKFLNNYYY